MAGSTGRPKRPLSLAAIVALVGALVACAPGDGVPPQIALAVPAAASTCSEWVALSLREDGQVVYRFKKAGAMTRRGVAT